MKLAAPLLCSLFLAAFPVAAQLPTAAAPEVPPAVSTLDVTIETVASGGYWQKGEIDGSFRVVILLEGWEHLSNKVLLQWIRTDQDKQTMVVEKSVLLTELNSRGGVHWRFSSPKFVLAGKQWTVVFPAESESGKKSFTVVPDASYGYKVTESKK